MLLFPVDAAALRKRNGFQLVSPLCRRPAGGDSFSGVTAGVCSAPAAYSSNSMKSNDQRLRFRLNAAAAVEPGGYPCPRVWVAAAAAAPSLLRFYDATYPYLRRFPSAGVDPKCGMEVTAGSNAERSPRVALPMGFQHPFASFSPPTESNGFGCRRILVLGRSGAGGADSFALLLASALGATAIIDSESLPLMKAGWRESPGHELPSLANLDCWDIPRTEVSGSGFSEKHNHAQRTDAGSSEKPVGKAKERDNVREGSDVHTHDDEDETENDGASNKPKTDDDFGERRQRKLQRRKLSTDPILEKLSLEANRLIRWVVIYVRTVDGATDNATLMTDEAVAVVAPHATILVTRRPKVLCERLIEPLATRTLNQAPNTRVDRKPFGDLSKRAKAGMDSKKNDQFTPSSETRQQRSSGARGIGTVLRASTRTDKISGSKNHSSSGGGEVSVSQGQAKPAMIHGSGNGAPRSGQRGTTFRAEKLSRTVQGRIELGTSPNSGWKAVNSGNKGGGRPDRIVDKAKVTGGDSLERSTMPKIVPRRSSGPISNGVAPRSSGGPDVGSIESTDADDDFGERRRLFGNAMTFQEGVKAATPAGVNDSGDINAPSIVSLSKTGGEGLDILLREGGSSFDLIVAFEDVLALPVFLPSSNHSKVTTGSDEATPGTWRAQQAAQQASQLEGQAVQACSGLITKLTALGMGNQEARKVCYGGDVDFDFESTRKDSKEPLWEAMLSSQVGKASNACAWCRRRRKRLWSAMSMDAAASAEVSGWLAIASRARGEALASRVPNKGKRANFPLSRSAEEACTRLSHMPSLTEWYARHDEGRRFGGK